MTGSGRLVINGLRTCLRHTACPQLLSTKRRRVYGTGSTIPVVSGVGIDDAPLGSVTDNCNHYVTDFFFRSAIGHLPKNGLYGWSSLLSYFLKLRPSGAYVFHICIPGWWYLVFYIISYSHNFVRKKLPYRYVQFQKGNKYFLDSFCNLIEYFGPFGICSDLEKSDIT